MKKKYLLALGGMIVIVAVLMLALTQVRSVRSGPQASTPTPSGWPNYSQFNPNNPNKIAVPSRPSVVPLKVTDLSPNVNYNDKATLIIRHTDGSEEAFLIAPDLVDKFISQLPKEDKLVQIISPGSIEDNPEVPISTAVP